MARNFIQPGETLTLPAPRDVKSGDGILVGAIFAVALASASAGQPVEARRIGVWDLTKATGQAWTPGQKVYWDNAAFNVTSSASGTVPIGAATQAEPAGDTIGRVLLTGQVA